MVADMWSKWIAKTVTKTAAAIEDEFHLPKGTLMSNDHKNCDRPFIYAVILHPEQPSAYLAIDGVSRNAVGDSEFVVPPTPILARSEADVKIIAHRKLTDAQAADASRLEVLVRPF